MGEPLLLGSIGWALPQQLRKEVPLDDEPFAWSEPIPTPALVADPDQLAYRFLADLWDRHGWPEQLVPCWDGTGFRFE